MRTRNSVSIVYMLHIKLYCTLNALVTKSVERVHTYMYREGLSTARSVFKSFVRLQK